jgi:hypothetical protein
MLRPMDRERRRHVRLKPIPELPARAIVAVDGLVREAIDVIDVSVSGLALRFGPCLAGVKQGHRLKLTLELSAWGEHQVEVDVRWASPAAVGVELVSLSPAVAQAVSRYVAELLERGVSG